ncbi:hypothetical protein PG984_008362 [Apiospora sp. TS-2023a]
MGVFGDMIKQCHWSEGVGSACSEDKEQSLASMWDKTGRGTVSSTGISFAAPKTNLRHCWIAVGRDLVIVPIISVAHQKSPF